VAAMVAAMVAICKVGNYRAIHCQDTQHLMRAGTLEEPMKPQF